MTQYWKIIRNFSPSVLYYTLALSAVGFAYFGVSAVIYNLFLLRLGFSPELIGQVNGIGQLAWATAALPASLLGRLGLRKIVVWGNLIIALGYTLLLLVNRTPETWQVTWLFAMNIMIWVGAALITVNGLPLLFSASSPHERHHAIAVSNAGSSIFAILGSMTAGLLPGLLSRLISTDLAQPGPYQLTFWLVPEC